MLRVEHVSKSFDRKAALHDISLQLNEGEIVGLLGQNGAGKTTLIRIINRILEPDTGSVWFGNEILSPKHLERIGYLPEERGLYKNMTVEAHAVFLGRLRGLTRQETDRNLSHWLSRFGMETWRKQKIEQLSKGMAQKVQFICTVLHNPDLLILDEPFSGFDPVNLELIRDEIMEFRAKGKSILVSTHNMRNVEEICDRVVIIHEARKVLEGNVSQIREELREGLISLTFRGSMIALVNALWTGFELLEKRELGDDRFQAIIRVRGENTIDTLLKSILGEVKIEEVRELLPDMQEIFMKTVKPQSV